MVRGKYGNGVQLRLPFLIKILNQQRLDEFLAHKSWPRRDIVGRLSTDHQFSSAKNAYQDIYIPPPPLSVYSLEIKTRWHSSIPVDKNHALEFQTLSCNLPCRRFLSTDHTSSSSTSRPVKTLQIRLLSISPTARSEYAPSLFALFLTP